MAARRLLLVHLFLPDTLDFQAWPDEQSLSHFRVPSQARGGSSSSQHHNEDAPPSPPFDVTQNLSVDELEYRLASASLHSDDGSSDRRPSQSRSAAGQHGHYATDEAVSDSEEDAPLPPINEATATRNPRSARGSFSEQNKKVSMSSLISEAASGGLSASSGSGSAADMAGMSTSIPTSSLTPRSRRGSANAPLHPQIKEPLKAHTIAEAIPVAPASDHGRSAPHLHGTQSAAPASATNVLLSARGRRGSSGTASAPLVGGLTVPLSEGAGSRTPGARAGGAAGTLTPLSIIGDLAAKQSAVPARHLPTPGDTDRHHPFGSGAVTPMREAALGATGTRTPGRRPHLSGTTPSRSLASGLTLTKLSENSTGNAHGPSSISGHRTPAPKDSRATVHSRAAPSQGIKPVESENWFIDDHGRGAENAPPQLKPARPGLTSRQPTQTGASFTNMHRSTDDKGARKPFASPPPPSQPQQQQPSRNGSATQTSYHPTTGPTGPANVAWTRSTTKGRGPTRQGFSGRRPSSIGSRSLNRRTSIDTFGEDTIYMESETPLLPPFDFVPNPSSNGGLVNAVKSLTDDHLRGGKVYIGTPGVSTAEWAGSGEKQHITRRIRAERDSVPVWVDDDTFEGAYAHFCKQILWPTFHYTLPTRSGLEHEHAGFECYRSLNASFAAAIVAEYKEGDIIFINDYHLLLVPEMVRDKLPHAKICFFLHIAWPSSEIFRCLTARTHILKGMLGADLVGFQTQNFARHFRQTVSRILQLEATPKGIQIDGRGGFVTVATFPIGIDVGSLNARRAEADVGEWVDKLRARYEGKKVIVGRDKLDIIKGVRQKLLAFETALDEHKDLVGKVVLLQVALATTEENEEVAAATDVVSRINNKYSSLTYQPVVFLHVQDITFCQYLALLTIADAFLATSLREGMNLTSHEFVVCQEVKHKPLILSEFTGTYSSLRACIGINPWNTKQVADAIYKAITMDDQEAYERWKDLHRQVTTQDAQHWIQSLLGRLERAHIDQQRRNNMFVPRLEIGQSEWRASKSRLILLDLEGTLMQDDPLVAFKRGFVPSEAVIKVLLDLTDDPKNRVYVLSGKGAQDLDKLVARVPCLGLVAESGCMVMYAGSAPNECRTSTDKGASAVHKTWTSLVAGSNMSWRGPVKEILAYFTERTPGSWLEDRGASLLWRFWSEPVDESTPNNKEFQWARRQAAEVQNLIYDSLGERFSLRIIPSKTDFLIMPKNTSRASAVQHIISLSHVGGVSHAVAYGNASPATAASQSFAMLPGHCPPEHVISATGVCTPLHSSETASNGGGTPRSREPPSPRAPLSPDLPTTESTELLLARGATSFRQPSNTWSFTDVHEQEHARHPGTPSRGGRQSHPQHHHHRAATNTHLLHPYGLGSFDLVLCIGQDDNLFAYINALDLPFAPITCTSVALRDKDKTMDGGSAGVGSEANYYADGPANVLASLSEILAFRGRDQRWGVPAMVDV